jgi:hypothetical protein
MECLSLLNKAEKETNPIPQNKNESIEDPSNYQTQFKN